MTDRELLELAAKAAGIRLYVWGTPGAENFAAMGTEGCKGGVRWNPLTDDGDALRLAVQMELLIDAHGLYVRAGHPYEGETLAIETKGADPQAATRRAIVSAAAAIGGSQP